MVEASKPKNLLFARVTHRAGGENRAAESIGVLMFAPQEAIDSTLLR